MGSNVYWNPFSLMPYKSSEVFKNLRRLLWTEHDFSQLVL